MKYAAVFALFAFAFLAQANARSILNSPLDRGVIADALRAKLVQAKEKLNNIMTVASDKMKATIAEIQKKADELIDQLKQKANQITDKVFVAAQKVINKIEKIEDKYLPFFANSESSTTEAPAVEDAAVESQ